LSEWQTQNHQALTLFFKHHYMERQARSSTKSQQTERKSTKFLPQLPNFIDKNVDVLIFAENKLDSSFAKTNSLQ